MPWKNLTLAVLFGSYKADCGFSRSMLGCECKDNGQHTRDLGKPPGGRRGMRTREAELDASGHEGRATRSTRA